MTAAAPTAPSDLSARMRADRVYDSMMEEMEESWTPHWKDSMELTQPRRGTWKGDQPNKGDKKNARIFDSSPRYSQRILTAGIQSGLTNQSWPWFELLSGFDPDLLRYSPVSLWMKQVERILYQIFQQSNVYRVFPTMYDELSAVASACMQIDESDDTIIHASQHTIGSFSWMSGWNGDVNRFALHVWKTVAAIVEQFGIENVSGKTAESYTQGRLGEWKHIKHLIEPNDGQIDLGAFKTGAPWRSLWWEEDSETDQWLKVGTFNEFPLMCPRWEVKGESVYGTDCPGMTVLPDSRQLMLMVRKRAEAVEKLVRPPLAVPSSMAGKQVSLAPSAMNVVDTTQTSGAITPILSVVPPLAEMRADIQEVQNAISRGYFADLFVTLINTRNQPPAKTATEIAAIEGEKLLMLGPVIDRIHNDMLKPLIDRTFNIAQRRGLLPDPPQELVDKQLDVRFVSTLAQAQRAVQSVPIERGVGFILGASEAMPAMLDVLDADATAEGYLSVLGFPPEMVTNRREREAKREQDARMAQAAQSVALAGEGAAAAKTLSETTTGQDSVLDQMLGQ